MNDQTQTWTVQLVTKPLDRVTKHWIEKYSRPLTEPVQRVSLAPFASVRVSGCFPLKEKVEK